MLAKLLTVIFINSRASIYCNSEHPVLTKVYGNGDWNLLHCCNCSTNVYLSHSIKQDKIFAFKELITDPSALIQSPLYSKVFGIILYDVNDQEVQAIEELPRKRLSSMNYGNDDPILRVAHTRMKAYLNKEEELMEQRIKKYEEKQKEEFAKIQKGAHEERRQLFFAILKSRDGDVRNEVVNKDDSILLESKPSASPITTGFNMQHTMMPKDIAPKSRYNQSKEFKLHENMKDLDSDILLDDDEGLFTFDEELKQQPTGYHDASVDATPFGLSSDDEDDSSTDGSSFHDDVIIKRVPSSLPMTVPMFMRFKEEGYSGSDDQIDPSQVAKSIQQLALSVQDTGMFGDLPKPRTNSRRLM